MFWIALVAVVVRLLGQVPGVTRCCPSLRASGVVYAGTLVVGFYIFCIMVTVGMKLAQMGSFGPMAVPILKTFSTPGLHFTASFDPQMPTMGVTVSAKLFQSLISLFLTGIQFAAFGQPKMMSIETAFPTEMPTEIEDPDVHMSTRRGTHADRLSQYISMVMYART